VAVKVFDGVFEACERLEQRDAIDEVKIVPLPRESGMRQCHHTKYEITYEAEG